MAFLTLAVAACSSVTPYPDAWPQPDAARPACLAPGGTFDNLGTWIMEDDARQRLLASIFFPLGASEPLTRQAEREAVTHVVLENAAEVPLRIRAFVGTDLLFEGSLETGATHCVDGQFVFEQNHWTLEGSIGAVAWSKIAYQATQDVEGGLLLRQVDRGGGLVFMVVPMVGRHASWLRFPAVTAEGPAHPFPPHGVRDSPAEVWQLLPPPAVAKHGSYRQAESCLTTALKPDGQGLTKVHDQPDGLDGNEFLTGTRDGSLAVQGWAHPDHGWVPGSHALRVRKQHWASPKTGDRYLECLLARGFRPERRPLED